MILIGVGIVLVVVPLWRSLVEGLKAAPDESGSRARRATAAAGAITIAIGLILQEAS